MIDHDQLIRFGKAAERLGMSVDALNRIVARGELTVVYPSPGVACIAESELSKFIASVIAKGSNGRRKQRLVEPRGVNENENAAAVVAE